MEMNSRRDLFRRVLGVRQSRRHKDGGGIDVAAVTCLLIRENSKGAGGGVFNSGVSDEESAEVFRQAVLKQQAVLDATKAIAVHIIHDDLRKAYTLQEGCVIDRLQRMSMDDLRSLDIESLLGEFGIHTASEKNPKVFLLSKSRRGSSLADELKEGDDTFNDDDGGGDGDDDDDDDDDDSIFGGGFDRVELPIPPPPIPLSNFLTRAARERAEEAGKEQRSAASWSEHMLWRAAEGRDMQTVQDDVRRSALRRASRAMSMSAAAINVPPSPLWDSPAPVLTPEELAEFERRMTAVCDAVGSPANGVDDNDDDRLTSTSLGTNDAEEATADKKAQLMHASKVKARRRTEQLEAEVSSLRREVGELNRQREQSRARVVTNARETSAMGSSSSTAASTAANVAAAPFDSAAAASAEQRLAHLKKVRSSAGGGGTLEAGAGGGGVALGVSAEALKALRSGHLDAAVREQARAAESAVSRVDALRDKVMQCENTLAEAKRARQTRLAAGERLGEVQRRTRESLLESFEAAVEAREIISRSLDIAAHIQREREGCRVLRQVHAERMARLVAEEGRRAREIGRQRMQRFTTEAVARAERLETASQQLQGDERQQVFEDTLASTIARLKEEGGGPINDMHLRHSELCRKFESEMRKRRTESNSRNLRTQSRHAREMDKAEKALYTRFQFDMECIAARYRRVYREAVAHSRPVKSADPDHPRKARAGVLLQTLLEEELAKKYVLEEDLRENRAAAIAECDTILQDFHKVTLATHDHSSDLLRQLRTDRSQCIAREAQLRTENEQQTGLARQMIS